jgi:transposase
MDPNQLFALALPLPHPWTVTSSALEGKPKKLTLTVDLVEGTRQLPCCGCGGQSRIHDRRERRWRHLNFWQYETELVARVPRTNCAKCGVHQVEVPWARPGSGFTLLFEAWALLLAREMAVSEAAETLGIVDTRLWRLLTHHVDKAHATTDWSGLERTGMDESERSGDSLPQAARRASAARQTSRRKGHCYVTCFVDLDCGNLLYMTEGRDAATVASFAKELIEHQSSPEAIKEVAMDMSPAFQRGVEDHLPEALKIFDRYHVMALAGKATDEVRKEVAREEGGLEKGAMWSLRGNKDRLTEAQREQRARICREYAKLGRALSWRECLADTWRYATREDAEVHLEMVCSWGRRCRLEPIKKLCATLKRHWDGILDYYRNSTTSGVMEGLNSRLQLARKRARGYRNWKNFRTIAYWIAGGLNPATGLPNPLPQRF